MNLAEQIYAQALRMTGPLSPQQDALLRILSRGVKAELEGRLRRGVKTGEFRTELVSAGSLLALAAFCESDQSPERFTAGELTVQRGSGKETARSLRRQAERIMAPWLAGGTVFLGV